MFKKFVETISAKYLWKPYSRDFYYYIKDKEPFVNNIASSGSVPRTVPKNPSVKYKGTTLSETEEFNCLFNIYKGVSIDFCGTLCDGIITSVEISSNNGKGYVQYFFANCFKHEYISDRKIIDAKMDILTKKLKNRFRQDVSCGISSEAALIITVDFNNHPVSEVYENYKYVLDLLWENKFNIMKIEE